MDDDEFETVEKKRPRESTCFSDIHVVSATVGILLLKGGLSVASIIRNFRIGDYATIVLLSLYTITILLALVGNLCSQPRLFFPFIVADIIFKVIFGIIAFGILLSGDAMIKNFDLLAQNYYRLPLWFCMFLVILFFLDVYAFNIVCRAQRYLVKKLHRDTINPSTDSMHDSIGF